MLSRLLTSHSTPSPTRPRSLSRTRKTPKAAVPNAEQLLLKPAEEVSAILKQHERGEPQKCLAHGFYTSNYCKDCQIVLCSECHFKKATHRMHKVLTLKEAEGEIVAANSRLQGRTARSIEQLHGMIREVERNSEMHLRNMYHCGNMITAAFDRLTALLKDKHAALLKRANTEFSQARALSQEVTGQLTKMLHFLEAGQAKASLPRQGADHDIFVNHLLSKLTLPLAQFAVRPEPARERLLPEKAIKQLEAGILALTLEDLEVGQYQGPGEERGPLFKVTHLLSEENLKHLQ
jgi:hypothetical protein